MAEQEETPQYYFTMPLIGVPDCGDDMGSKLHPDVPPVPMPEWRPTTGQ